MKSDALKIYPLLLGAVAFAFIVGMGGFSADSANASDLTLLAKGKVKVDDAPKPHGPLHKFLENGKVGNSDDLVLAREFEPREPPRRRDPRLQEKMSDEMMLTKGRGKVDDAPKPHGPLHKLIGDSTGSMILVKGKVKVDDAPKPHGPLHKLIGDSSDGMLLAKNKKPASLPGAPPIDAPIKNAPHAPGAVHG